MDYDPAKIYDTQENRLNTILDGKNSEMWRMITNARKDWQLRYDGDTFWDFLEQESGICVSLDSNGFLLLPATIVDQEKFLIFVLKYK
jgi:hypothetical protein